MMALDSKEIYYGVGGERFGPVDIDGIRQRLAAGTLGPDDYLWDPDLSDWIQVRRYPFLFNPPSAPGPTSAPITEAPEPLEAISEQDARFQPAEAAGRATYRNARSFPYAGFGIRLLAWILDTFVLMLPALLWLLYLLDKMGMGMESVLLGAGPNASATESWEVLRFQLILEAGMQVIRWVYEATLESSRWQATIGKRLMGLVVTDEEGRRISFARASGRCFAKILSQLPLWLGFFMIAFTERRQGLHDKLAGTLVMYRGRR